MDLIESLVALKESDDSLNCKNGKCKKVQECGNMNAVAEGKKKACKNCDGEVIAEECGEKEELTEGRFADALSKIGNTLKKGAHTVAKGVNNFKAEHSTGLAKKNAEIKAKKHDVEINKTDAKMAQNKVKAIDKYGAKEDIIGGKVYTLTYGKRGLQEFNRRDDVEDMMTDEACEMISQSGRPISLVVKAAGAKEAKGLEASVLLFKGTEISSVKDLMSEEKENAEILKQFKDTLLKQAKQKSNNYERELNPLLAGEDDDDEEELQQSSNTRKERNDDEDEEQRSVDTNTQSGQQDEEEEQPASGKKPVSVHLICPDHNHGDVTSYFDPDKIGSKNLFCPLCGKQLSRKK